MWRIALAVVLVFVVGACFVTVRGRHGGAVTVHGPSVAVRPRLALVPEADIYYAPEVSADLFFYQNSWYWYSNNTWYISVNYNGPWRVVSTVPAVFYRIPASHPKYHVVRTYPERHRPGRPGWASLRAKPRLVLIPEAGIYYAPSVSVDLFFLGGIWYWRSGSVWYSGSGYNGPWRETHTLPQGFLRVPRSHPKHRAVKSYQERRAPAKRVKEKSKETPPPKSRPKKPSEKKSPKKPSKPSKERRERKHR